MQHADVPHPQQAKKVRDFAYSRKNGSSQRKAYIDDFSHTYLFPYPLEDALHEAFGVGQNFRRDALGHPCARQLLEIAGFLGDGVGGDFGEEVIDVHCAVLTGEVSCGRVL